MIVGKITHKKKKYRQESPSIELLRILCHFIVQTSMVTLQDNF